VKKAKKTKKTSIDGRCCNTCGHWRPFARTRPFGGACGWTSAEPVPTWASQADAFMLRNGGQQCPCWVKREAKETPC